MNNTLSTAALLSLLLAAGAAAAPTGIGARNGNRTGPVTPPPAPITALALGPQGERALVGDARGHVRRFGLSPLKGESLGTMPGAVTGLAWSAHAAAAICDDGSVAWIGTSVQVIGRHATGAQALALTPEGMLFTGADDGTIRIWKPGATHPEPRPLAAHKGPVSGLALRGKYLLSVGWDGQLKSWRLPRARASRPRLRKHKSYRAGSRELTSVVALGDRVVTSCFDGELVVWRWERRRYVPTRLAQRPYQEWVRTLSVDPAKGRVIAIAPAEQTLLVVDPEAARVTATLPQAKPAAVAAALPAGGAVVGRYDGTVDLIPLGGDE